MIRKYIDRIISDYKIAKIVKLEKSLKIYSDKNILNNKELKEIRNDFNNKIEGMIKKVDRKVLSEGDIKQINDLSDRINDIKTYGRLVIDYCMSYFKDKKYRYNVIIILKNNKLKAFEIFENTDIEGFYYNKGYYNIDKQAVYLQNNKGVLFYVEGIATPVNIRYNDRSKSFIELSTGGLVDVVNGKSFEAISKLGQPEGFWKSVNPLFLLIGLGILVLAILHMTGQIDLGQMLKMGGS